MSEPEDLCAVRRRVGVRHQSRLPRHGTTYVVADTKLCEACGDCVEACRKGVLSVQGPRFHRHVRFDRPEECRGCGKCVEACPHGAIAFRVLAGLSALS